MTPATMAGTATEGLRAAAANALGTGGAAVVIGYARRNGASGASPVFARTAEQAATLVFDNTCKANLTVYLAKPEVRKMGRIGLVVKRRDLRAVNVLIREHVVKREDLYLIGIACDGEDMAGCDEAVVVAAEQMPAETAPDSEAIAEFEAKTAEERWGFWRGQFEKCIRCYACRQVCPLCYCKRCIVEKNAPQWVDTSAHLRGNTAWNAIRAFHLTGRCVGCGECERACPMDIPLGLLNQKMALLVRDWFQFESGASPEERAPFTVWSPDDADQGIL